MSLYTDMIEAGIPVDHHESDLYVPNNVQTRAILAQHGKHLDGWNVQLFTSQIDGTPWLDIPFHYDPFWHRKQEAV